MSRVPNENKNRADKLLRKFNASEYPAEYPWVVSFLCKVKINSGKVNTANQQDTLDELWRKYGEDC